MEYEIERLQKLVKLYEKIEELTAALETEKRVSDIWFGKFIEADAELTKLKGETKNAVE